MSHEIKDILATCIFCFIFGVLCGFIWGVPFGYESVPQKVQHTTHGDWRDASDMEAHQHKQYLFVSGKAVGEVTWNDISPLFDAFCGTQYETQVGLFDNLPQAQNAVESKCSSK